MTSLLRTALVVTAKDLRQRVRDRSAWIIGIAAPLLLSAVLGQIIGGFTQRVSEPVTIGHVVDDRGAAAMALVDRVLPDAMDGIGGTLIALPDVAAAEAALLSGEVDAVVVVPDGVTAALERLEEVSVTVLVRPNEVVGPLVAEGLVSQWASEVEVRASAALAAIASGAPVGEVVAGVNTLGPEQLLQVQELASADRVLDGPTQVSAGLAVFFLFFTVQLGVVGLIEERQSGTYDRLRAAPVATGAILGGKILTSVVIGFVATVVLLTATTQFLGASWGPTLPVLALIAAAVLAAVSLVVVVAGFAKSADSANNAQGVIGIVLGMLGGSFFPVATRSGLLATLSDLTPHGMFLTAVGDLQVAGAGIGAIVPQLLGLIGFALAVGVGAGRFVRLGAST